MEDIIKKFKTIKDRLSAEHGEFRLFGLFLKDESVNTWDVIVSSEWACSNENIAIKEISKLIAETLSKDEVIKLTAIFITPKNTPIMNVLGMIAGKMNDAHLINCSVNGIEIKDAYILDYDPSI